MDVETASRPGASTLGQKARAYAMLVRVPNLFTAPPDVFVGAAVAAAAGREVSPVTVIGLSVASMLLYGGGTSLNDYFDAPEDARQRPERPIPTGEVSRREALVLGLGLLLAGVVAAGVAAERPGAIVAALVAAGVLAYDGLLKGGTAGFLTMGGVRGLNVVLGTTATGVWPTALPAYVLAVPLVVAGYIAAVTFMAERETEGGNRGAVAVAIVGTVIAALAAVTYVGLASSGSEPFQNGVVIAGGVVLAVGFLVWTGNALGRAYAHPVPATVGPAVGTAVLGVVVLDAAFAAVAGVLWAVAALVFLVPSVGLSRAFDVT